MAGIIFNKDGEKFEQGAHLVIPYAPEPIHGLVASTNGLFLIIDIQDGPPPYYAKTISKNLTIYGFTKDKTMVALW